jgi:hypothetical protein
VRLAGRICVCKLIVIPIELDWPIRSLADPVARRPGDPKC